MKVRNIKKPENINYNTLFLVFDGSLLAVGNSVDSEIKKVHAFS